MVHEKSTKPVVVYFDGEMDGSRPILEPAKTLDAWKPEVNTICTTKHLCKKMRHLAITTTLGGRRMIAPIEKQKNTQSISYSKVQ